MVAVISKIIKKAFLIPNRNLWNIVPAVGLSMWWHMLQSRARFFFLTVNFVCPHLTHAYPFDYLWSDKNALHVISSVNWSVNSTMFSPVNFILISFSHSYAHKISKKFDTSINLIRIIQRVRQLTWQQEQQQRFPFGPVQFTARTDLFTERSGAQARVQVYSRDPHLRGQIFHHTKRLVAAGRRSFGFKPDRFWKPVRFDSG